MKLIYVVIDGMGDLPIPELGNETPLGAAETPNMDFLARNGKTGLMYTVRKGIAPESDAANISLLGYDSFKYSPGRGILEAIGSGVTVNDGDLVLRCNFATLGPEKNIIDRRAGRDLTTEETSELEKVINEKVKLESHPVDFEFRTTMEYRGVLIMRSRKGPLSSKITNTDPAYSRMEGIGVAEAKFEMTLKECMPTDGTEEARISANLVNEFIQKSHVVLDNHEINNRRAAEEKLKANIIITRDAGHLLPRFPNINEKYGVRFVCFADMPVERGIAKMADMHVAELPSRSEDLGTNCTTRVNKLLELLPFYDCFYIHVKGIDEPSHYGDFSLKKQLIATVDKYLLENLLQKLSLKDHIICVTADHSTPCKLYTHSDDPVPLLISGDNIDDDNVTKFSEKECQKGSLGILQKGTQLMPMLMDFLRKGQAKG